MEIILQYCVESFSTDNWIVLLYKPFLYQQPVLAVTHSPISIWIKPWLLQLKLAQCQCFGVYPIKHSLYM